jgi:Homeodomain-like domain
VPRRYADPHEVELARWLIDAGLNDSQIARLIGVSRPTVRDWRRRPAGWPTSRNPRQGEPCPRCHGRGLDPPAYVYLLGLYLGDGTISRQPSRVYKLRIACAQSYPHLIEECRRAVAAVRRLPRLPGLVTKVGCVEVYAYWNHWPCLFPQHGKGPKHERPIRLTPWQWGLVVSHPRQLLRGLLHSDGSRVLNRVNGRDYPRYFFTNHSHDIRAVFTTTCDLLDIRWRRSNWRTISIARRRDVRFLDRFVGPKR